MPLTPKNPKSLHSYTYYFRQPHLATIDDRNGQRKLLLNVGDTLELSNSSLITIAKFKRTIGQAGTIDTDEFQVVGKIFWPFCSCVEYGGFLARWKKEVFDALEEREVPLAEIVRKVRLIRTNRVFPQMHDVRADGEFYCRYKGTDSSLIRLAADECDKGVAKAREHLLQKQHLSQAHTPRRANQRYTYGDCFCGIGGTANGAREAGLQPIWAFDSDAKCAELYRENFPFSDVRAITVDQFLGQREIRKVDVLHISPPCQTWSLAHTCVGQNDDDNTATIFTVSELVKRAKPRVVTLEQVPGFMWKEENKSYPSDAISADEQSVLWESFARFLRTRILGEMGIIRSGRLWGSTEKETFVHYCLLVYQSPISLSLSFFLMPSLAQDKNSPKCLVPRTGAQATRSYPLTDPSVKPLKI